MTQTDPQTLPLRSDRDEIIPPVVGRALICLLVALLGLVAWMRLTDQPLLASPPDSPVVEERLFRLDADLSGKVRVFDSNDALLADLGTAHGGFISTIDRVVTRERGKHQATQGGPVLLMRHENGRYSLHDPSTGWTVDLMAFGRDNVRAFARLLPLQPKGNE